MTGKKSIWDRIIGKITHSHYKDTQSSEGQIGVPEELIVTKPIDATTSLEKEKALIRAIEADYSALTEQEFYEKYKERFLWDLFPDMASYHQFGKENHNEILGFLLVNALVTDGYILQMDWKDDPEEYLPDFINERLEADYGLETIDMDNSGNKARNVDMYETEYVKSLQKSLKHTGFRLVWFLLDNDQYYAAIVPYEIPLGDMWKEIKLYHS